MNLIEKAGGLAEREREQLASGKKPAPRFAHKVQRTAFQALAVFFVLMLMFTLLSRAAVGVTVARVEAERTKTGVLTQRTTISGNLAAQGDLELTLPGGIRVTGITATVGQRVAAGDTLLELDEEGISAAAEKLRSEIALLDLKISGAVKGNSGTATDNILNAKAALAAAEIAAKNAREDYDRQREGRTTAEGRVEEDLLQAQADYDKAKLALEKAGVKAKADLLKTTQEKLDTAKEALESTKESAKDAKDSAQQAVDSAKDQQTTVDSSYFAASAAYARAVEAVTQAQNELNRILAETPNDTKAIATARAALTQAQNSRDQAESSMNSYSDSSNSAYRAVKRAEASLKTTNEKWAEKVKKAEAEVTEADGKYKEAQEKTDMSEEAAVLTAQGALDGAERTLKSAQRSADDAAISTGDQLLTSQRAIETAQRGVESAQRSLDQAESTAATERAANQTARQQTEVERLGYVNDRREAEKKLEGLLTAMAAGGKLVAPADGTVLFLMAETGLTTEGTKVAALSRNDQGFEFSGKLSQKEAETLSLGDEGSLTFSLDGKSQEMRAKISAIGMADDKGLVEIAAILPPGNYPAGASAKMEISKRSEQYPVCLPLGALRNDGADFVLVLREKQTVMGTEQTVEKVPVTVLSRDSEQMAVEAFNLQYDDMVIVSANKPISQGDRVRIEKKET